MHICLFSITKISLGQNSLERNCWVIWWVMLSKKTTYSRKELYHFICRVTMEVLIKPPPPAYRETVEFCSIKATLWHPMCTQSRGPRKAKNTAFVRAHQDSFLWGHFGLRVPLSLYGHSTDISTGLYQSANAAVTSAKKRWSTEQWSVFTVWELQVWDEGVSRVCVPEAPLLHGLGGYSFCMSSHDLPFVCSWVLISSTTLTFWITVWKVRG